MCSSAVNHLGTRGLRCSLSQDRLSRYNNLNEIIHRSLSAAKVPARIGPSSILRSDGKCPNGMRMTLWSHGHSLVWTIPCMDVTCVEALCTSNLHRSTSEPGAAADYAGPYNDQICQPYSNM